MQLPDVGGGALQSWTEHLAIVCNWVVLLDQNSSDSNRGCIRLYDEGECEVRGGQDWGAGHVGL